MCPHTCCLQIQPYPTKEPNLLSPGNLSLSRHHRPRFGRRMPGKKQKSKQHKDQILLDDGSSIGIPP
jgi:hypothetical protein